MKRQNYNGILAQKINILGKGMLTIEQKLARNEAERNRLMAKKNSLENGQKIIIGGMFLSLAKSNAGIAKFIIDNASTHVTRAADLKRIAPLLDELKQVVARNKNEDNSL